MFEEIRPRLPRAADVERYLALEFPEHRFPPEFAALIHAKTEGSPLFMADLVRYLRDSGSIVEAGGTWVLARAVSERATDLPESVRSMIARKIERLDERDRELLLAASVQGHRVRFGDRQRGARDGSGGRRGAARRRSSACTSSSSAAPNTSFPT